MSDEEDEITVRTSKYIIKLNLLQKKVTIETNVSDVLDSYLEYLRSSQIYLTNGIFKTNFAEGALMLQSSAQIYSKKVDLLWDCVMQYHERITSYEEKTEENADEFQKIEERKVRFKRKKKVPEVVEVKVVEQKVEEQKVDGQKVEENKVEQTKEVKRIQKILNEVSGIEIDELIEYEMLSETPDGQFEGDRLDINYYDEWSRYFSKTPTNISKTISPILSECIREEITPIPKYILKIPKSVLKTSVYEIGLFDEFDPICEYTLTSLTHITDFNSASLEFQHNILNIPFDKLHSVIPSEHIYNKFHQSKVPINEINLETFNEKYMSYMKSVYQLSPSLQYTRRKLCPQSLAVSLEALPNEVLVKFLAKANLHKEIGNPLRKTIDSHSDVESGFFEQSDFDITLESDNLNSSEVLTPVTESSEVTPGREHDADADSGVDTFEGDNRLTPKKKRRIIEELEYPSSRKRRTREKLLPTITVKYRNFEKFFFENYQPEEGEGEVVEPIFDYDSDTDDTCAITNDETETTTEKSDTEKNVAETSENASEEKVIETSSLEKAALLAEEKAKRYSNWKEFIYKTIKKDNQVDYDIHEEGTKILNSIPENGVLKYSSFNANKSTGEVCRSFAAMLQLANSNNVELLNTNSGGLANDTLELKLLTKERPHERLFEYTAPSEMVLAEKLERVARAKKHSLPSTSGTAKKFKLA